MHAGANVCVCVEWLSLYLSQCSVTFYALFLFAAKHQCMAYQVMLVISRASFEHCRMFSSATHEYGI